MGMGDLMPSGGGHRHKPDPKRAQALRDAKKKLAAIEQREKLHREEEEARAEEAFQKELKTLEKKQK